MGRRTLDARCRALTKALPSRHRIVALSAAQAGDLLRFCGPLPHFCTASTKFAGGCAV
jgi:hypothetical protein